MSQPDKNRAGYLGLKLFMATILSTLLLFLWSSSDHKNISGEESSWIDQSGHLHVLNITLGITTLRDAEVALKSRSDIAIYIYPKGHAEAGMKVEAFFPAIADHSKVILELQADHALLQQLQQRSTLPHLYPNNVARMNLHPEDLPVVKQLIVKKLTLIPSIEITPEILKARFGEPARITTDSDAISYYHYPQSGLIALLKQGDASKLRFMNQ